MKIHNVDGEVFCGPEPKTTEDWQQLIALGVNHVLDLQTGSNWLVPDGEPLENQIMAARLNMIGWSHPLGSVIPPTKRELYQAVDVMQKYRPIYVHCKDGVDRTGIVLAAYRTQKGWTRAEAVNEMRTRGSRWWHSYWWMIFLLMF